MRDLAWNTGHGVDNVEYFGYRLPHRIGQGPTRERFGDRVEPADQALCIGRHDGVADGIHRDLQKFELVCKLASDANTMHIRGNKLCLDLAALACDKKYPQVTSYSLEFASPGVRQYRDRFLLQYLELHRLLAH